jgi:hypothetical protein
MASEPLPGDYPITLYRGDTRVWTVEFLEDDGSPFAEDLSTGHTFRAQIRATADDASAEATITVVATSANVLELTLAATAAAALTGSSAVWDLEVTRTSDGFVRTYLTGDVEVDKDVSRA